MGNKKGPALPRGLSSEPAETWFSFGYLPTSFSPEPPVRKAFTRSTISFGVS